MEVTEKVDFKPQFGENSVDLTDFYDLKEKKVSLEEERYNLMEQLRAAKEEIEELKTVKETN